MIHAVSSLALKARHLGGSSFCNFRRLEVPVQALGEIPLRFGIDKRLCSPPIVTLTFKIRFT